MSAPAPPRSLRPDAPGSGGDDRSESARRDTGRPLVGVGGVLFDPSLERVLLIQRGAPPARGLWSVPGGLVEWGEPLRAACAREVWEETGLEVELADEPVKLFERVLAEQDGRVRHHFLIVDFWGQIERLEPRAGSDVLRARWVALPEVDELPTTLGLEEVIERALSLARGEPPRTPLLEHLRSGLTGAR